MKRKQTVSRTRMPNWDVVRDGILLGILRDIQLQNRSSGGLFNTEQWNLAAQLFRQRAGLQNFLKEHMQNRYKNLKKSYALYNTLKNKSGWGWDNDLHTPIPSTKSDWDKIIAVNKDYKTIKGKSFPQYDDMHYLCGQDTAQGCRSTYSIASGNEGTASSRFHTDAVHTQTPTPPAPLGTTSCPPPERTPPTFGESSFRSKRRRRSLTGSTSSSRSRVQSDASTAEMIDLTCKTLRITRELLAKQKGTTPSFGECMGKIEALEGLTDELFVVGLNAMRKRENRYCVQYASGRRLLLWLESQQAEQTSSRVARTFPPQVRA